MRRSVSISKNLTIACKSNSRVETGVGKPRNVGTSANPQQQRRVRTHGDCAAFWSMQRDYIFSDHDQTIVYRFPFTTTHTYMPAEAVVHAWYVLVGRGVKQQAVSPLLVYHPLTYSNDCVPCLRQGYARVTDVPDSLTACSCSCAGQGSKLPREAVRKTGRRQRHRRTINTKAVIVKQQFRTSTRGGSLIA